MKTPYLLFITLLITIGSCTTQQKEKPSQEDIISEYYRGFSTADFSLVSKSVSDSMLRTEMDFVLANTREELYVLFQWDSVFGATYSVIDCKKDSSGYICSVAKTCRRIEFLQDSSIICKNLIEIEDDKISRLSTIEFTRFDVSLWEPRRDSLVAWIDENHPELSGFVYDVTPEGAQKYLQAIEYYEDR